MRCGAPRPRPPVHARARLGRGTVSSENDLAWSFSRIVCLVGDLSTMPKIEVNKVAEILKKNEISPAILRKVIEEMNLAVQPDTGGDEKPPAVKKQFVILVSD